MRLTACVGYVCERVQGTLLTVQRIRDERAARYPSDPFIAPSLHERQARRRPFPGEHDKTAWYAFCFGRPLPSLLAPTLPTVELLVCLDQVGSSFFIERDRMQQGKKSDAHRRSWCVFSRGTRIGFSMRAAISVSMYDLFDFEMCLCSTSGSWSPLDLSSHLVFALDALDLWVAVWPGRACGATAHAACARALSDLRKDVSAADGRARGCCAAAGDGPRGPRLWPTRFDGAFLGGSARGVGSRAVIKPRDAFM
jgi:hypothetical protein